MIDDIEFSDIDLSTHLDTANEMQSGSEANDYVIDEYHLHKMHSAASEIQRRDMEAMRIYRPSKIQEQYHASTAKETVFVAGNQIGKSIAGYSEDGRAAGGCDPYGKYPEKDGILAIVVYKESQIRLNTYRYLLKPGAFDIIQDEETGIWKPYYPWVPSDVARADQRRPAPPILPPRMIKRIHWKSKMGNVLSRIDMENGWEIHVFSSTAKPDAGFQADLVHIDEDIANEEWYVEMIARLSIRKGLLRWTALPLFDNDALPRIVERADDEAEKHARGGPVPTTTVVRGTIFDNPYLTDDTREENIKRWKDAGDDVYRQRALGELITDTVRMYPTFTPEIHAVQRYGESHPELFGEYLRTRRIPDDWCLRLFVDPGFSTCAALLFATLRPEGGDDSEPMIHVAVREIYRQQCDASIFAQLASQTVGDRWLQAMVIDAHGGRLTGIGDGRRPQEIYESELAERNVVCVETGSRFRAGCDDIVYRETALRQRLIVSPVTGLPEFMYDEEMCPNLEKEMVRFRKLRTRGVITDKGNRKAFTHAVECFCDQTEVLTESGWKRFADASISDRLATVNLDTDTLEFQHPSRIVERPHNGPMVHVHAQKLNAMVTPNHRMVYYSDTARRKKTGPSICFAGDLSPSYALKLAAKNWNAVSPKTFVLPAVELDSRPGKPAELNRLDFARFMGWYIAEGSADKTVRCPGKGYRVCIAQRKEHGINAIREMLSKLPFHFVVSGDCFVISNKQLWSYLRQFGDCYTKFVPDWVRHGSREVIESFMEGAMAGDGWVQKNARRYGTSSPRLADDIQELFLKLGCSASVTVRSAETAVSRMVRGKPCKSTCDFFTVIERLVPSVRLSDAHDKPNFSTTNYTGKVFCATVPNGTLVVRRNGQPLVAGNCYEYAAADELKYHAPPARRTRETPGERRVRMWRERQAKRRKQMGGALGVIHGGIDLSAPMPT